MMAHGETLGVLHLRLAPDLADADRRLDHLAPLAANLAEQLALAVANARLRETLRNQSIRDALTGLFNRRYLEETFEREFRRAERQHRPLG
jgi:GGDEF domain-containing protein